MSYDCCWFNPDRKIIDCPNMEEGEESIFASPRRRLVEKCIECPLFRQDIQRIPIDSKVQQIIQILSDEYIEQKGYMQSISSFLNSKSREIKFLHELNTILLTSMSLDEILSVAMTAITSGKGFGLNRAFLLMHNRVNERLEGYLGIGPKNYEEAWKIWDEVDRSNFSLKMLSREFYKTKLASERVKFHDTLEQLSVSTRDESHIFNRAMQARRPLLIEDAFNNPEVDKTVSAALGVERFLIMPLLSRNRRIGILLADNFITNKSITPRDMESLQTFAFPVAFAIERATLYEQLRQEVDKQSEANRKLLEQQELIVRMEQMALIGKITSSVAHSIRNPLFSLSGHVRNLLKVDSLEQKNEIIEIILNEAGQLDDALDEILSYADAVHPTVDIWDLNQLTTASLEEIEHQLQEHNCRLEIKTSAEPLRMRLDYKQISWCLKSIVRHLLRKEPPMESITVSTAIEGNKRLIRLTFHGNGLIAEDEDFDSAPLFDTETLRHGGEIALCRMILEKGGNRLLVENLLDGDIAFIISLSERNEEESQ